MASTLPVPIEFSLPDGWLSVPPDEVGTPESAFVALHPPPQSGFTANISIAGELRTDGASLIQVADESLARLQSEFGSVQMGKRNETGSDAAPGLTQAVRMNVQLQGSPHDLVQLQAFLGMADTGDEEKMAVVQCVLTALPEQFENVLGDFQEFLSTIRPDQGGASA
jgi:hypothetical protein